MFPYLMMMSLVGLLSGILNSLGRFAVSAGGAACLKHLSYTAILLYANADTEITGAAAAWGVFAGGVVQLGLLMFGAMRQGFSLRLRMPKLRQGLSAW